MSDLLEFLNAHLHWHEYRPWVGGKMKPNPTACGGCGQPKTHHPTPNVLIFAAEAHELALLVLAHKENA